MIPNKSRQTVKGWKNGCNFSSRLNKHPRKRRPLGASLYFCAVIPKSQYHGRENRSIPVTRLLYVG
jgi:hypothetical protein